MLSKNYRRRIIIFKIFLFSFLILNIIFPAHINSVNYLYANEGTMIYSGKTDEFDIKIKILPEKVQIGIIHFSITPYNTTTKTYPHDAKITLTAKHLNSSEAYQVLALNQPTNQKVYSANIKFDYPGEWEIKLNMQINNKVVYVNFPMDIQGVPLPSQTASLVFPITFAILISGSLYIWLKSYKNSTNHIN